VSLRVEVILVRTFGLKLMGPVAIREERRQKKMYGCEIREEVAS